MTTSDQLSGEASPLRHDPIREERRGILPKVNPNGEQGSFRILSGEDSQERTNVRGTAAALGLHVSIDEIYPRTQIRDGDGITPFVRTDCHS